LIIQSASLRSVAKLNFRMPFVSPDAIFT